MAELSRHFRSGSWEVQTDRAALQDLAEHKFYDRSAWMVSYPAGSGQALLFDGPNRPETLRALGRASVSDQVGFVISGESLPQDYGALLNSLPQTTPGLRAAKSIYASNSRAEGLEFPAYDIYSTPAYDNDGALNAATLVVSKQSGKCKGSVYSTDKTAKAASVLIISYPRLLELKFVRPWLSDKLLDEATASNEPRVNAYFRPQGALTNIPDRVWLIMPDRYEIKGDSASDVSQLQDDVKGRVCCRLVCPGVDTYLDPASLAISNDIIKANRRDVAPLVLAVISRRRLHAGS